MGLPLPFLGERGGLGARGAGGGEVQEDLCLFGGNCSCVPSEPTGQVTAALAGVRPPPPGPATVCGERI